MNYRHIYHAGSFTDVIKHLTLISVLNKLSSKATAYCVIDAFAGTGLYDLADSRAAATNEAAEGILQLNINNQVKSLVPKLLKQYLDLIYTYNNQDINIYPGSPSIIEALIRAQDQLIACELHPADYLELRHNFAFANNVSIHNNDAYLAIKAFTPPRQGRGLVFVDPPFEQEDEFDKIILTLKILKKRFLAGINIIWFPIKKLSKVQKFYNDFINLNFKESILVEFAINKQSDKLNNIGLLIVNPPWQITSELTENLEFLVKYSFKKASFNIKFMNN